MRTSILFMAIGSLLVIACRYPLNAQGVTGELSRSSALALLDSASAGAVDGQKLIDALSKHDASSVALLRSLLGDQGAQNKSRSSIAPTSPRRDFTPMGAERIILRSLERIGSAEAFAVVYDAAQNHQDAAVRANCFGSIATGFQEKASVGGIQPEKQLLFLFLSMSADTIVASDYGKPVGELAHMGFREWTVKGGLIPITAAVRDLRREVVTGQRPYWQRWWDTHSPKIKWDPVEARFRTPRS